MLIMNIYQSLWEKINKQRDEREMGGRWKILGEKLEEYIFIKNEVFSPFMFSMDGLLHLWQFFSVI